MKNMNNCYFAWYFQSGPLKIADHISQESPLWPSYYTLMLPVPRLQETNPAYWPWNLTNDLIYKSHCYGWLTADQIPVHNYSLCGRFYTVSDLKLDLDLEQLHIDTVVYSRTFFFMVDAVDTYLRKNKTSFFFFFLCLRTLGFL